MAGGGGGFTPARLLDVLDGEGLAGPVGQTSKSLVFDCPRCSRKAKLYLRKKDGRFVCWYCATLVGFEGRPEVFLAYVLGVSKDTAYDRLYGIEGSRLGLTLELPFLGGQDPEDEEGLPYAEWPHHCHPIQDPQSKRGAEYLASRGIPMDVAVQYRIHYSPQERRVYFPVEVDGILVGHQARLVMPHEWIDKKGKVKSTPKILSSANIPRDRVLMFQDRLRKAEHGVLVEGPVDAIKCHLVGGNVASMGKIVSNRQLGVLRDHGIKRLYSGLDPDAFGELARIVRSMAPYMEVYQLRVPAPFKDLGEMSFEQVYEAFQRAQRVHPWQLFQTMGMTTQ